MGPSLAQAPALVDVLDCAEFHKGPPSKRKQQMDRKAGKRAPKAPKLCPFYTSDAPDE